MKPDLYLSACLQVNSRETKDLNLGPDTLKLLLEKVGKAHQVETAKHFVTWTLFAQIWPTVDRCAIIKLKSSVQQRKQLTE